MSKEECKNTAVEDVTKYGTKETYNQTIQQINESKNVDLKDTKGIKRYCVLNDLKYFHILDNMSVDIMHDLMEGTVPFLSKQFFTYGMARGIFTENVLDNHISYFNYGQLNSSNIPSQLAMNKKNLGQNASQMKCLIQHLPLILFDFHENELLKNVWLSIQTMLKILQIVYSSTITKSNLDELKKFVSSHLESLSVNFGCERIPKHHMMIHYASVIERIGPLVHISTLKYEMKHKTFTNYIKNSNNFKSVSKTLAN